MSDDLRVNGNAVSWGSLIFKTDDGGRWTGFTAISFADKRERVKGYGMTRHHAPVLRSRGKYNIDPVKVTGWTWAVQRLREQLAARASDLKSYGDVEFHATLQYVESSGSPPLTVNFERLVWASNTSSHDEGPDPLKEEFELDCMLIRRNGLILFDGSEGEP